MAKPEYPQLELHAAWWKMDLWPAFSLLYLWIVHFCMGKDTLIHISSSCIFIVIIIEISLINTLFQDNFQAEVMTYTESLSPMLVCFHATWGKDVPAYLSAIQRSKDRFDELGAQLRFGAVDLTTHQEGRNQFFFCCLFYVFFLLSFLCFFFFFFCYEQIILLVKTINISLKFACFFACINIVKVGRAWARARAPLQQQCPVSFLLHSLVPRNVTVESSRFISSGTTREGMDGICSQLKVPPSKSEEKNCKHQPSLANFRIFAPPQKHILPAWYPQKVMVQPLFVIAIWRLPPPPPHLPKLLIWKFGHNNIASLTYVAVMSMVYRVK